MKPVHLLHRLLLAAAIGACPLSALSLECGGEFVDTGISEAQLLELCGEPDSRDGANWIYRQPGSLPVMVTFANGVVIFIRDVESEDDPAQPFGDRP